MSIWRRAMSARRTAVAEESTLWARVPCTVLLCTPLQCTVDHARSSVHDRSCTVLQCTVDHARSSVHDRIMAHNSTLHHQTLHGTLKTCSMQCQKHEDSSLSRARDALSGARSKRVDRTCGRHILSADQADMSSSRGGYRYLKS